MNTGKLIRSTHHTLFNEQVKKKFEQVIIVFGLIGFAIHLLIILLHDFDIIQIQAPFQDLFHNPISAIYTPFSFILIYEVYLLVYYIPESFSNAIAKQFEIISIIEVRNIFKDISKLKLDLNWFSFHNNVVFTVDIIGFIFIFFFTFLFYKLKKQRPKTENLQDIEGFILSKKAICALLIVILAGLSVYSLIHWIGEVNQFNIQAVDEIREINTIFYDEFFSVLIVVDVIILIISFRYTENYSLLIRNSGFVISTIMIRLSFQSGEILNMILIVIGILFGLVMLKIYNLIMKIETE